MNSNSIIRKAAENLFYVLRGKKMLVVRALVWRPKDDHEISQVEVMKFCDLLGHKYLLAHFRFGMDINCRYNYVGRIEHSFETSPSMIKPVEFDNNMVRCLETCVTAWSKKEDLLLGRNENDAPNPWIIAEAPFFGNIFLSSNFRTTVPAYHPDMLPVLMMCMSTMSAAFAGVPQGSPASELETHFGSLVSQARRASIRDLYGRYSCPD